MGTRMRPWTRRLLDLIDQGVTEQEALITGATAWVPEGHAFRVRAQHNAASARRRRRKGEPKVPMTPPTRSLAEIHRIGAREVLHHALRDLTINGHIVREGTRYYRRPDKGRDTAEPPGDAGSNGHPS